MVNFSDVLVGLFGPIWQIIGSLPFLISAVIFSFTLKSYLLITLGKRGLQTQKARLPWLFLLIVLVGAMAEDFAWIVKLLHNLLMPALDYRMVVFFIRISWGFLIIRYQALAFFIESLSEKRFQPRLRHIPFTIATLTFSITLVGIAFTHFSHVQIGQRSIFEFKIIEMAMHMFLPLILASLFVTMWRLRSPHLPRILRKQLKVLSLFLVTPCVLADLVQVYPFYFSFLQTTQSHSVVAISTIFLTCTIYYSARRVIGLRFLNIHEHVYAIKGFDFMKDFKHVLEQFSHVASTKELTHITKTFFKNAFNIPVRKTHLYIRHVSDEQPQEHLARQFGSDEALVEGLISAHDGRTSGPCHFLKKAKIVITDELAFNTFYEENEDQERMLSFLANINADIFIPIYDKETIVAYITIERYARTQKPRKNSEFYSSVERDQMVVFAAYLGNIIHLLHGKSLNNLIAQEKELQEELYNKQQKIEQYKESIRSFLRTNKERKIGIIFYKNRRFVFGNRIARDLIRVNINTHEGHRTTKALKKIAQRALEYKSQQTCFERDAKNNKLMLSAIPNVEQNNVIIAVYYPEISDILKKKIELLSDPTKWDYLLYLETTKSGKLINHLIPGTGETLLNFKIELLRIALSKKAILLNMPPEDLMPTVELLHHVSLRKRLEILDLQNPTKKFGIAIKLFGINPIFGSQSPEKKPLLGKLNRTGTLFIQNIHLLDFETQNYLAELLQYGIYRIFKSDQKKPSDVRIICSTTRNLQEMVQEGTFSQTLFRELQKATLAMPPLEKLSDDELQNLAAGFSEQAIQSHTFKNLLELTDREKSRIASTKPTSLYELKKVVRHLLEKKSQKNEIQEDATFTPAYSISDPELAEAARLGKHALKNPKIMARLWNRFKNQNKIAMLLGVNRSSVNRRCKKYKLIP